MVLGRPRLDGEVCLVGQPSVAAVAGVTRVPILLRHLPVPSSVVLVADTTTGTPSAPG